MYDNLSKKNAEIEKKYEKNLTIVQCVIEEENIILMGDLNVSK